MLQHALEHAGTRWLVGTFARILPFAIYALLAARVTRRSKLAIALGLTGLVAAVTRVHPNPSQWADGLLRTAAWLLLACAVVQPLRRATQAEIVTRPALAMFCVALFLVAPGVLVGGEGNMLAMVLGFELTFSAFSYCVEEVDPAPDLGECLRFLLVNPLLVYRRWTAIERSSAFRQRAALRVLLGAGVLFSYHALVIALPFTDFAYDSERIVFSDLAGYAGFVAMMVANLVVLYLAHSGLASLQIGCMRLLGYDIPERYRMPFLARSPDDLWQRWNTYLGDWLKRYLFAPFALALWRRERRLPAVITRSTPILVTFVLCGLMHDLAIGLRSSTLQAGGTIAFGFAALSIVAWIAIERGMRRARWPRLAVVGCGVAFAVHSELLLGFVALPSLAGEGLPRPLRAWLFG